MPPLYLYDDYDRCLEKPGAIYCLVDGWIVPNASNARWTVIRQFSADTKRSFRHDRLQRGLCMDRCHQLLGRFDHRTQMKYFLGRFEPSGDVDITFDPNTFRGALDWRNRYRRLANQCVNYELKRQYALMAYSTVEYCTARRTGGDVADFAPQAPTAAASLDTADVWFLVVLGMLLLLATLSTSYDCHRHRLGSADRLKDYYRTDGMMGLSDRLLVAFSLPRNWHTLMTVPEQQRLPIGPPSSRDDLRFVHAVRFLTMYLVIAGHSMLFNCILPLLNPEYVEMHYRRFITMLLLNGVTVVQTFFTISGFLLAIQFTGEFTEQRRRPFGAREAFQCILCRFLRLTPVYGFMVLLDATWLIRLQDGPIWRRLAETERTFCRNNWWANVLYVNNYLTVSEPCLQQCWYLATDFQLYVLGLLLLGLTCRYPKTRNPLFAIASVASILAPAIVTYVQRFEGVVMLRPEALKYVMWYDPMYRLMYIPTHTNAGSYLAGLIGGLMYRALKQRVGGIDATGRHDKLFRILWYAAFPVAIAMLLSAYLFYAFEFEKPALWIALYAGLCRNLWGLLFAVLFVGLAVGGVGVGALRGALCSPIFRPLGKVTYGAFLCHLFIIRVTLGNVRQPVYVSDMRILVSTFSTLVLAYLMGTLLYLLIEAPFSNVQKALRSPKHECVYKEEIQLVTNGGTVSTLAGSSTTVIAPSAPSITMIIVAIGLLCTGVGAFDVLFGYNQSEYWQMPQLQVYDSMESCLHNRPAGVFCVTKVAIKPDSRSTVWRLIKKYSKYTFQYNHDVLTRGVCVDECAREVGQLVASGVTVDRYYEPRFNITKRFIMPDWLLPNVTHYRKAYGRLVNVCQNYALRTQYNLSGYVEIEDCTTNDTLVRPIDVYDIAYMILLVVLVLVTIGSQCYDCRLARAASDPNHYERPLKSRVATALTAFSLRRNWAALTRKSCRAQYQQDLYYIDQLRVMTMSVILLLHVFIGMCMFTSQNPLVMEQFSAHPISQMLFSLVPAQVDMFFSISGLLLAVQFLQYTENKHFRFSILWQGLVNRYLRSLPVYAVLMLFTVSHYDTFLTTPSAYKIQPKMRLICRRKWWINFLFINNYYQPEEQCLIHTWYLAADFQLFVVGLCIMTALWRFPKATFWMVAGLGLIGFVLPMLNTYLHALDAMMPLTMKGNEYQLWYDEYFVKSYQATEMHCASFFAGMIAGLLYHRIARKELTLPLSTLRIVFSLGSIAIAGFALQAPLYNMINFTKPSAWMALLSGVHKVSIGAFYSTTFLLLTFQHSNTPLGRWLTGNTLSRVLARLGFGFYLMQMTVLKIVFANYPEDTRINVQLIITTYCCTFVLSYAIALVAFLLVEKPFDVLLKLLLGNGGQRKPPA
uniref:Acyltransferase 3 domain-containing protein n=1 Tax=Anopheles albimanus TaxID=7167 RepID=A0A182FHE2_ANOAL